MHCNVVAALLQPLGERGDVRLGPARCRRVANTALQDAHAAGCSPGLKRRSVLIRRALRPRRVPADRPQPLPTHLRELRGALLGPLLLFGLLLAATFAGSDAILRAMLDYHGLTGSVSLYAPAEFLRVRLGLAALAALLGALPLALYHLIQLIADTLLVPFFERRNQAKPGD